MSAKDFLGQSIQVGDTVVATELKYRNLIKAEVLKVTPKMVNLRAISKVNFANECKQYHDQVVVINNLEGV